jgi:hypothetical protein
LGVFNKNKCFQKLKKTFDEFVSMCCPVIVGFGPMAFRSSVPDMLSWHEARHLRGLLNQGCQMLYFQTENPTLGKFWKAMKWKIFVYFTDIWSILRSFGIFCVAFMVVWYIFPVLVSFIKKNLATLFRTNLICSPDLDALLRRAEMVCVERVHFVFCDCFVTFVLHYLYTVVVILAAFNTIQSCDRS